MFSFASIRVLHYSQSEMHTWLQTTIASLSPHITSSSSNIKTVLLRLRFILRPQKDDSDDHARALVIKMLYKVPLVGLL